MQKEKNWILVGGIIMGFICGVIFFPQLIGAGNMEPPAPPGPTMKTLDEIPPTWSQKLPSSERFQLVLDGEAVLDKETGLVWERMPNSESMNDFARFWGYACDYCFRLEVANRKGWRPPTIEELASLIDNENSDPTLPSGHPFTIEPCLNESDPCFYWSSTTPYNSISSAWGVDFRNGNTLYTGKGAGSYDPGNYFMWCVRGGQGHNKTE